MFDRKLKHEGNTLAFMALPKQWPRRVCEKYTPKFSTEVTVNTFFSASSKTVPPLIVKLFQINAVPVLVFNCLSTRT